MTTDEFIKKQQDKINAIVKYDKPLLLAVRSVMAAQSNRVFRKGLNAENSVIGNYKGGELYVSVANSPVKFTPKGKPSSTVIKKDRKTGYFPNYLAYKKTIGKNKTVQTVDLMLSNELSRNWANATNVANATARKVNVHSYYTAISDFNYDKVERYNNVFGISKQEKELFLKVINHELKEALK